MQMLTKKLNWQLFFLEWEIKNEFCVVTKSSTKIYENT